MAYRYDIYWVLACGAFVTFCNPQILSSPVRYQVDAAAEIMSSCAVLPSPDDIRQAMFFLRSSQLSLQQIKRDISELRKKCIVTSKGDPYRYDVTFRSGVTASLRVNICYPHFAGGVVADDINIDSGSLQLNLDIESIKAQANKLMCSNISEMCNFLNDKIAL